MIPRVINYCWFGKKPKPDSVEYCIDSWRKNCPSFIIREWNENNFDFSECQYAMDAYKLGRWAFVSDYARIRILNQFGGIYCDTDVELIKSLDDLLDQTAFIGFERGLNGQYGVNSGSMMGAKPGNDMLTLLENEYRQLSFVDSLEKGQTCVEITTELMVKHGLNLDNSLQQVLNFTVYPYDYFSSRNMKTGEICLTKNTRSIHHYDGTWADPVIIYGYHLKWELIKKNGRYLGMMAYCIKYSLYIIKNEGIRFYFKKLKAKIKSSFK